jgi:2-amino-4-hydroxy-6-hydroxymethyldihydropteridine diphosphokinase
MKYFIGLGSNIGAREKNLEQARLCLVKAGVNIMKESSVYETEPVGNKRQPWFLNQVLNIETGMEPAALLRKVKAIEKKMGRIHVSPKGPRCIDIDILLAEDRIVNSADLVLPHPELANRNFVLTPLIEIAADTIHPVFKKSIDDLCQRSTDRSIVRLFASQD